MTLKEDKSNIDVLVKELESKGEIYFKYNTIYYDVYVSGEGDYGIDMYSSPEKDEDGDYLISNQIDGGVCDGGAKDAIEFMLKEEE